MNYLSRLAASVVVSLCTFLLSGCQQVGPAERGAKTWPPPHPAGWALERAVPMPQLPGEAGDPAVLEKLSRTMDKLDLNKMKFADGLDALGQKAGLNISANWAAMEARGIRKDWEIGPHRPWPGAPALEVQRLEREYPKAQAALRLHEVTFEDALSFLLTLAAGRPGEIDYLVRDGIVKVSTVRDLNQRKYIVVYDIRDLRAASQVFARYAASIQKPLMPPAQAGHLAAAERAWDIQRDREWTTQFMELVRTSVWPHSWQPTGDAVLKESQGRLIVKQSIGAHRELAKLLAKLRLAVVAASPGMADSPRPMLNPHERQAIRREIDSQSANQRAFESLATTVPVIRFTPPEPATARYLWETGCSGRSGRE